ncbi:hypothetical protein AALB64_13585 [Lachnospiraceae bacterium 45-P1]
MRKRPGSTLMEVMVAMLILLMSVEMVLLGISFSAGMRVRVDMLSQANEKIGERMARKEDVVNGTLRMELEEGIYITSDAGRIYRVYDEENQGRILIQVIGIGEEK